MRLGLARWLIFAGLVGALTYWRLRRQGRPVGEPPSTAESHDAVDEGLGAAGSGVARLRDLLGALRGAVGQALLRLRGIHEAIPPALSDAPAEHSRAIS